MTITTRHTGAHAPDCPCKRCQADAYNRPMMGEPILLPIDHAQRHRPHVTYVTR